AVHAAARMDAAGQDDLLHARAALDLADELATPRELGRQVAFPRDVVVEPSAPGDAPRKARLPERVDHVGPREQLVGVEHGDAGALVADEADVGAGGEPLGDLVRILRDLPPRPVGLLGPWRP